MKAFLRSLAYHGKLLPRYHRKRNRNALTVVLFHRVLPTADPAWAGADPEWTVTTEFFDDCLAFFAQHYTVVDLPGVLSAYQGKTTLPSNPLLITFDDGWKCNLAHAAPLLEKYGFPAVLFVTTGALGKPILSWQEALYALWHTNRLDMEKLTEMEAMLETRLPAPIHNDDDYLALLDILRRLPPRQRGPVDKVLIQWCEDLPGLPYMLDPRELVALRQRGFHLGTHGVSHESLTRVEEAGTELASSKEFIENLPGSQAPVVCFSPPQGLYDQQILETAEALGYQCACTSRKGLNRVQPSRGFLDLGRINIDQPDLCTSKGKLDRPKLAAMLFRQPLLTT